MDLASPQQLSQILGMLERSTSFAEKYGPFFFACALLAITPFISSIIFRKTIEGSKDAQTKAAAYQDFRFYFRSTVGMGLFCVVAGVAWWGFSNFRESDLNEKAVTKLKAEIAKYDEAFKKRKYVAFGIVSGIEPNDEFFPSINDGMIVTFSRLEPKELLFYVLSDKEIPQKLNMNIVYRQFDISTKAVAKFSNLPLSVSLSDKMPGQYKFQFGSNAASFTPNP